MFLLNRGIIATRQLAKRQLTWLRGWPNLKTFSFEDKNLNEKTSDYLAKALL